MSKYKEIGNLKCIQCNNEMIDDDRDYNFKGNYDAYLICEYCHTGARAEVRYGKLQLVNYYNEDGLDKTIKFNTSNLDGSEFD